jgi:lipoprotein-anchoring transpeptidase ErfK/SrfK
VKTLLSACAALLIAAPAASAQLPTPPTDPQPPAPTQPAPPTTPAPAPAEGKGSIEIASGLSDKGRLYVASGQRLRLSGRVKPYVAGQKVIVELFRGHKSVGRRVVEVGQAKDSGGAFSVVFRLKGAGNYTVKARHKATAEQARFTMANKRFEALRGGVSSGSGSKKIHLVQMGLKRLAYVTSTSGHFDGATSRAVIAFKKVNRMSRNGSVSAKVFEMLLTGHGGFRLKYPNAGKHVEGDLSHQVLVLARDGKAERIYHMSSGKPSTPTVTGSFRFYRKQPGTNSHEMVFSSYFIRGYAIHGYKEVPTHAASHGCLRVPIPNAVSIYRWVGLGDRIFVYR